MNHPLLFSTLALLMCAPPSPAASEVRLAKEGARFQLLRDGEPYFVRGGGGGADSMGSLAQAGGNSLRLWGDDDLGAQLDAAHKLGLTICAGIWLGQVRQGFDWTDADGLAKQREQIRATVLKHKDHPALLVWALGNEMEDPKGKNGAVWTAINSLAVMVKQLDPKHPTMTVVAEIGGDKVKNIHRLCPEIDIVGINSYGGAVSVGERYQKLGGTKPYLLTEYGPRGIWEVKKDALGAYPEPTSTEKADIYRSIYKAAVLGQPTLCLGSYAFLWGQKQEATATWFSLFLEDGARLGGVDALSELWTGKAPANRCPTLQSLEIDGPRAVEPGSTVRAKLRVVDPEKETLKVTWLLQRDAEEFGTGGDKEEAPPVFPEAVTKGDASGAEIALPKEPGLYRLFAFARDASGGAAVANVTLRVNGVAGVAKGSPAEFPLSLYAEEGDDPTFVPAGWMGDAKSIRLDPASTERPLKGKTCLRCEFFAESGWGGVVWQSPAGDWGDRGSGYDLTGAKKITFWARGATGDEVVNFQFGLIPKEKKFSDTATGALDKVTLTSDWKQYEIPVAGLDLTRIKTGFAWTLASAGAPVVFYLDNIRWE